MPLPAILAALLPALASAGGAVASAAGAVGSGLASAGSAIGSGLASGAGALGSGVMKGAGLAGQAASTGASTGGSSLVNSLLGGAGQAAGNIGKAAIPQIAKMALSQGGQSPGMMQAPQIQAPGINTDFSQNRLNTRRYI